MTDQTAALRIRPLSLASLSPTVLDVVAVEAPLTIRVRGRRGEPAVLATTMRTPGDDHALAVGLCLAEGLVHALDDLVDVQQCPEAGIDEDAVLVTIARDHVDLGGLERRGVMTSACGVCGRTMVDDVAGRRRTRQDSPERMAVEVLRRLPDALRLRQRVFDDTGGLHAVALFDLAGDLVDVREDVGRHNAFDKVVGRQLRQAQVPLRDRVALLSGRASYELVAKAATSGVAIVAAIGAPSSLAVETAEACGITLVGFLRGDRGNVYTHAHRLEAAS